jgi:glycine cleavage system H protein
MEILTDSHEWIKKEGSVVTIGITHKAAEEIGEIVYVDLPKIGQKIFKGEEVVVLESTKAAIDSYAPLSGEVIEINHLLKEKPELINQDPENSGWIYKIKTTS